MFVTPKSLVYLPSDDQQDPANDDLASPLVAEQITLLSAARVN